MSCHAAISTTATASGHQLVTQNSGLIKRSRNLLILVRPDGLFALRAHPFGVALRAINLAEDGQVVEPAFCASGVRTKTAYDQDRPVVLNPKNNGAPGEIRTADTLVRSGPLT
jgi:hypothetical protein